MLTKVQKEQPRYRVIHGYERQFKRTYVDKLADGLDVLVKRAKKMVKDNVQS
jgi:hypothetical protein